ncbi:glycosyltransferase family 2 protein [Streptomyces sp. NBC_01498]|uniref:glycosyltransferase n=1 Tax=Streptomyces sp. NBC_01498 TaxID=2975870 RepID=UPI002E7C1E8B|nr:glycosyltransferase family A protein [Streptomyces sp. NBC_01498]WTL28030.1 glycosyltransferase family 2 protein [Streptomyces sp. NBC_01498]
MTVKAVAVVIPAHNEERLLPRALDAVRRAAAHPGLAGVRIATVVVTDSCVDRTAEIAARAQAVVVSTDCQNPGTARAVGVAHALDLLGADGTWIASTDADSAVPPHWLSFQHTKAHEGWAAVVGTVRLPPSVVAFRHSLRYHADRPAPPAPWDHPHVHGANLGVSANAYRDVEGFQPLAVGEDRALVRALLRRGHRILRTDECPVLTSDRLHARATGGFAHDLAVISTHTTTPRPSQEGNSSNRADRASIRQTRALADEAGIEQRDGHRPSLGGEPSVQQP